MLDYFCCFLHQFLEHRTINMQCTWSCKMKSSCNSLFSYAINIVLRNILVGIFTKSCKAFFSVCLSDVFILSEMCDFLFKLLKFITIVSGSWRLCSCDSQYYSSSWGRILCSSWGSMLIHYHYNLLGFLERLTNACTLDRHPIHTCQTPPSRYSFLLGDIAFLEPSPLA